MNSVLVHEQGVCMCIFLSYLQKFQGEKQPVIWPSIWWKAWCSLNMQTVKHSSAVNVATYGVQWPAPLSIRTHYLWCTYKKFFLRMRVCVSLTNVWIDVKFLQGESGGMGNFTMTNWEHFQFTLTPSGSPALGSGDATSTVDEITNRMYLKNESKPRMGKRKPIKMRPKIMINQHNSQLWISISFIRGWFSRHFRGFWGSCNQAGLLDVQTTRLGAIHIGLQKLRSSKLW